jgi:hypothetical protein
MTVDNTRRIINDRIKDADEACAEFVRSLKKLHEEATEAKSPDEALWYAAIITMLPAFGTEAFTSFIMNLDMDGDMTHNREALRVFNCAFATVMKFSKELHKLVEKKVADNPYLRLVKEE